MDVRKIKDIEPFVTKDGSIIREVLHPSNSAVKNQSLAEATVKPGERTREHVHEKSEEIYYILKGSGMIKVGEEESDVTDGNAILIPPGTPHYIKNTGPDDLVLLCCCAPAYSHEDTTL